MTEAPEAVVRVDLGIAELRRDGDGVVLLVDGIAQSHVDLADPSRLDFAYQQVMATVVDHRFARPRTIRVTHLGGGAMALARWVAATRPRSPQRVIEVDGALVALVRRTLGTAGFRVTVADALAGLAGLAEASADVVLVDVFAGGRVPGHLTTPGFWAELRRVVAPDGVVLANLADVPGLGFTRGQLGLARTAFAATAVAVEPAVRKGRRFGNLVLVAGREIDADDLTRALRRGPGVPVPPWDVVALAPGPVVPSPPPPPELFATPRPRR